MRFTDEMTRFMKRNYSGFSFRVTEDPGSDGIIVWLSGHGPQCLVVRTVKVRHTAMVTDLPLFNVAEAVFSLGAACAKQHEGGRLTQEDAIRGWL